MPDTTPPPTGAKLPPELHRKVLITTAVQQALLEVMEKHRPDILKRARAKLKMFGIEVSDDEIKV